MCTKPPSPAHPTATPQQRCTHVSMHRTFTHTHTHTPRLPCATTHLLHGMCPYLAHQLRPLRHPCTLPAGMHTALTPHHPFCCCSCCMATPHSPSKYNPRSCACNVPLGEPYYCNPTPPAQTQVMERGQGSMPRCMYAPLRFWTEVHELLHAVCRSE